jgi:hypothetical protein
MLNVYDYHTEPLSLLQSEGPFEYKFDYDTVEDAIDYIREHIMVDDDEITDEFKEIAKVFKDQFNKCYVWVSSQGEECSISPIGTDSWAGVGLAVHLYTYENSINGDYVHYKTRSRFCQSEPALHDLQVRPNIVRDLIIKGLKALAIADIND